MAKNTNVVKLPVDLFKGKTSGFGLDIGGSLIKLAFIPDKEGNHIQDGQLSIHLCTFTPENIDEAVQTIKDNCLLPEGDAERIIPSCGFGCGKIAKYLKEKYNFSLDTKVETEIRMKSFQFLKDHVPTKDLCHPIPDAAATFGENFQRKFAYAMEYLKNQMKEGTTKGTIAGKVIESNKDKPDAPVEDGSAGFVSLGSAFSVTKLGEKGTMGPMTFTTLGGKSLLGLGKLLTGAKSFDEFISLAGQGDASKIHIMAGDMKTPGVNDIYQLVPDDMLTYCFGKIADMQPDQIEQLKKEDIARGLIMVAAEGICEMAIQFSRVHNISKLYVGGSLAGCELFREHMYKRIMSRAASSVDGSKFGAENLMFMKDGGYVTCLGLLIQNITE